MQWQPLMGAAPGLHGLPQPTTSPRWTPLPAVPLHHQHAKHGSLQHDPSMLMSQVARPVSPEESRNRRRSRTPVQPAPVPQVLSHASPHAIRTASPTRGATASSSSFQFRHTSPHKLQQGIPQPLTQASAHPLVQVLSQPQLSVVQPSTADKLNSEISTVDTAAVASSQVDLAAGISVSIGEVVCQITSPLGMGSFGVVWAADCPGVGEVAVKEILCQSQTDLSRAVYEAQLLYMLGAALVTPGTAFSPDGLRIPAYVASDMAQVTPEVCRVRLAMSRLAGDPLDKFLHEHRQRLDMELANINDEQQALTEQIRQATQSCHFAQELVLQLAPTMDRVASLAYHRDVNAHNILISLSEQPNGHTEPQFGLVDFGLAVDAAKWRGGPVADARGQGDWQHLDVGGDCRYWPASAWLQFEVGCFELAEYTSLCMEYQTHLDLQGLGITALQVLAELLPPVPGHIGGWKIGDNQALIELWKLRVAWDQYWEAATSFWTALLDTFRNNGDWNALKTKFISIGVHDVISRKLCAVQQALHEVGEACRRSSQESGFHGAQALFSALLVLVSSGEERGGTTPWSLVLAEFGATRAPSSSNASGPSAVLVRAPPVPVGSVNELGSDLPKLDSPERPRMPVDPPPSASAPAPSSPTALLQAGPPSARETPPARLPDLESQAGGLCRAIASDAVVQPPEMVWLPPPDQSDHEADTLQAIGNLAARSSCETVGSSSELHATRTASPPVPTAASPRSPAEERPDIAAALQLQHSQQVLTVASSRSMAVEQPDLAAPPKSRAATSQVCTTALPRSVAEEQPPIAAPIDAWLANEQLMADSPTAQGHLADMHAAQSPVDSNGNAPLVVDEAQSHDLFLKLSNLASKVVQLAQAMEKLELRDRDLAASAAGRIAAPLASSG